MNKKKLLSYTCAALICLTPITAYAAWTVIDPTAVGKLTDQLKKAQEQIQKLQEIKQGLEEQIKAIGKATQIQIPSLNLDKLTGSLKRTLECTLINPDELKDMMPSLNIDNIDIKSVCQGKRVYQDILFGSPQEFKKLKTRNEQVRLTETIHLRRRQLLTNTTSKSLAFADKQLLDANALSESAKEFKYQNDTVESLQDRLAVIGNIQLLTVQGQVQTNQLLSMLLKLQASQAVTTLPSHSSLNKEKDTDDQSS